MKPRTPARKYHFMLGTTSRVPGAPGWHYLILDIDNKDNLFTVRLACPKDSIFQQTKSGQHVYTRKKYRLPKMLSIAKQLGADRTWARLALERGWAFLADKGEVKIPWPVERMVLGWRKNEQTRNHTDVRSRSASMESRAIPSRNTVHLRGRRKPSAHNYSRKKKTHAP